MASARCRSGTRLSELQALAPEYRISPATASLSLSASTATLAVSMLGAAALSDRRGRKPVMAAALVAASLLGLLVPLARGFTILLAIRLLMGVALAGLSTVAMTHLAEEVPPGRLGLAMGLLISGNAGRCSGSRSF